MKKTALRFPKNAEANSVLSVAELERHARDWLFDGEYRQHSRTTLDRRRIVIRQLLWFLQQQGYSHCGVAELRQFLGYLTRVECTLY